MTADQPPWWAGGSESPPLCATPGRVPAPLSPDAEEPQQGQEWAQHSVNTRPHRHGGQRRCPGCRPARDPAEVATRVALDASLAQDWGVCPCSGRSLPTMALTEPTVLSPSLRGADGNPSENPVPHNTPSQPAEVGDAGTMGCPCTQDPHEASALPSALTRLSQSSKGIPCVATTTEVPHTSQRAQGALWTSLSQTACGVGPSPLAATRLPGDAHCGPVTPKPGGGGTPPPPRHQPPSLCPPPKCSSHGPGSGGAG